MSANPVITLTELNENPAGVSEQVQTTGPHYLTVAGQFRARLEQVSNRVDNLRRVALGAAAQIVQLTEPVVIVDDLDRPLMLATPVNDREVVSGGLAARIANGELDTGGSDTAHTSGQVLQCINQHYR